MNEGKNKGRRQARKEAMGALFPPACYNAAIVSGSFV